MDKAAGRIVVHQSQSVNHSDRNSMATFPNGWICQGNTKENEKIEIVHDELLTCGAGQSSVADLSGNLELIYPSLLTNFFVPMDFHEKGSFSCVCVNVEWPLREQSYV